MSCAVNFQASWIVRNWGEILMELRVANVYTCVLQKEETHSFLSTTNIGFDLERKREDSRKRHSSAIWDRNPIILKEISLWMSRGKRSLAKSNFGVLYPGNTNVFFEVTPPPVWELTTAILQQFFPDWSPGAIIMGSLSNALKLTNAVEEFFTEHHGVSSNKTVPVIQRGWVLWELSNSQVGPQWQKRTVTKMHGVTTSKRAESQWMLKGDIWRFSLAVDLKQPLTSSKDTKTFSVIELCRKEIAFYTRHVHKAIGTSLPLSNGFECQVQLCHTPRRREDTNKKKLEIL